MVCFILAGIPTGSAEAATTGKWRKDKTGWWYQLSGNAATTYKSSYGKTYPYLGWYNVDGTSYFFDEYGYCVTNGYVNDVYVDRNGKSTKYRGTWKKNNKGWWYEDTTGWYPRDRWMYINGLNYHFNKAGYVTNVREGNSKLIYNGTTPFPANQGKTQNYEAKITVSSSSGTGTMSGTIPSFAIPGFSVSSIKSLTKTFIFKNQLVKK